MDNQLTHYGVKGMRWGVRRSKAQLSRSRKKRGDDASKYSDEELKRKVARMNLEKQYSQMTRKESPAAKKFLVKALATSAATLATAYISKYMKNGAKFVESNILDYMERKAEEDIAARLAGLKR